MNGLVNSTVLICTIFLYVSLKLVKCQIMDRLDALEKKLTEKDKK